MYLSRRSEHSSSNFALVRVVSICFGPSAVAVMKGKLEKQKTIQYNTLLEGKVSSLVMQTQSIIQLHTIYLMFVWVKDDSSILAFSAVSVRRWRACLSFRRSMPSSLLKFPASQSTILWKYYKMVVSPLRTKTDHNPMYVTYTHQSRIRKMIPTLSKSSPPKWVSPEVESTSNTPSPTSSTATKVKRMRQFSNY